MTINAEILARIRVYLDEVAARVERMTETERRELRSQLESHIHEALQARTGDCEPQMSDLEAVLAEMDAPESYGPAVGKKTGWLTQGNVALCLAIFTPVAAGIMWVALYQDIQVGPHMHLVRTPPAIPLFLVGELVALLLGIRSWKEPNGKTAVFISIGLLLISVLFMS